MVRYDRPRQRKLAHQSAVLTFPDELLAQILDDLPTSDALKLRLTHKHFSPACSTILQRRLKCLYIHPSATSLRATIDICHHPVFNQKIAEIILLGKVLWRNVEQVWPGYRQHGLIDDTASDDRRIFRAWPEIYPRPRTQVLRYRDTQQAKIESFEEAYQPVIRALEMLPKLKKISFAEHTTNPGFNAVSQAVIDGHAKKHGFTGSQQNHSTSTKYARSDIEVLFGLLTESSLEFSSLSIGNELPFTELIPNSTLSASHRHYDFVRSATDAAIRKLTSLAILLDCGWVSILGTRSQVFYRMLLRRAQSLQRLRIVLRPNAAVKKAKAETTLDFVLGERTWPHLTHLEIVQPTSRTPDGRSERPACQVFNIDRFLVQHEHSLTHLVLDNVTFVKDTTDRNIIHTTQHTLLVITKLQALRDLRFVVSRLAHDPRCTKSQSESLGCAKYNCGFYLHAASQSLAVEEMVLMVAELGVEYDEESMAWNLGRTLCAREP